MKQMEELLEKRKEKELERKNKLKKLFILNEKRETKSFYFLERNKDKNTKIINYYRHQHFLLNENDKYLFIFITITLNPINNFNNDNETFLNSLKRQNKQFELFFSTFTKHLNIEYIKVKELTKKNNIHIHTLLKINKNDNIKVIETLLKTKETKKDIGAIDIKLENIKSFQNFKYQNYHNFLFLPNDPNVKEKIKKGDIVKIGRLNKNENGKNLLNYILKYIKKNNQKNKEQDIFNVANIKKITTSYYLKLDKEQEKRIIYLHYKKDFIEKDNIINYILNNEILLDKKGIFTILNKDKEEDHLKILISQVEEKLEKEQNDFLTQVYYGMGYLYNIKTLKEWEQKYYESLLNLQIDRREQIITKNEEEEKNYKLYEYYYKYYQKERLLKRKTRKGKYRNNKKIIIYVFNQKEVFF